MLLKLLKFDNQADNKGKGYHYIRFRFMLINIITEVISHFFASPKTFIATFSNMKVKVTRHLVFCFITYLQSAELATINIQLNLIFLPPF